jgi:hypothetical protein
MFAYERELAESEHDSREHRYWVDVNGRRYLQIQIAKHDQWGLPDQAAAVAAGDATPATATGRPDLGRGGGLAPPATPCDPAREGAPTPEAPAGAAQGRQRAPSYSLARSAPAGGLHRAVTQGTTVKQAAQVLEQAVLRHRSRLVRSEAGSAH